ncbi:hypothetical protein llap_21455 [Limosa lapponica baueri]|uniref:Uncharacterized protein n=1 Tax=Limosa lapponica baueri TaxID=1758121 RepID=A0A2I0T368_LIMLA|nr:hypothetical protein llap_21455 [Limosa lapponica baueri]
MAIKAFESGMSFVETPGCFRFSSVFPSLNMAVKRREQTLQDYKRLQSKVEKYEEKERTGPVLAKLHQNSPISLDKRDLRFESKAAYFA